MKPSPMIYLLRHGALEMGPSPLFVGQVDLELSETGIKQIGYWRDRFKGIEFQRIICNDLKRSRQTAEIIAEGQRDSLEIVKDLREINLGDWDGRPMADVMRDSQVSWRNDDKKVVNYRSPNGESFQDLKSRVIPVFDQILEQWSGRILIAGHAGVNRIILTHLLGMPLENMFMLGQDYGCLNLIDQERHRTRAKAMNIRPGAP